MRLKYSTAWLYSIITLLLLVASCSAPDISTPGIGASTPSLESPTSLPSPSISPTLTPAATLTAGERQALVKELLQTNGGCELPCWWGVVPGQTDWQTVREQFIQYGGFIFQIPHPERHFDYRVRNNFAPREEIVRFIHVEGRVFVGATSEQFAQDWRRYSLSQILMRFGEPSQVILQLAPPTDGHAAYLLHLYYSQLGIGVGYFGLATFENPVIQACPTFDSIVGIDLWLQAPEEEVALIDRALTPDEMDYFRPLEEATGISIEEFYNTFSVPESQVCLEGPSTWP
jgi:hypothetical protein